MPEETRGGTRRRPPRGSTEWGNTIGAHGRKRGDYFEEAYLSSNKNKWQNRESVMRKRTVKRDGSEELVSGKGPGIGQGRSSRWRLFVGDLQNERDKSFRSASKEKNRPETTKKREEIWGQLARETKHRAARGRKKGGGQMKRSGRYYNLNRKGLKAVSEENKETARQKIEKVRVCPWWGMKVDGVRC